MAKAGNKVYGFVLHFGYVESSRVGVLLMRHMGEPFDTVVIGLKHLANYFLRDYLESPAGNEPSFVGFQEYLYSLVATVASGPPEPSFMPSYWNAEEWWPWNTMGELYPLLAYFYENTQGQGAESLLCHHVNTNLIIDKDFRREVIEFQKKPNNGDKFELDTWKNDRSENPWSPVVELNGPAQKGKSRAKKGR